jgi:cytoskeletal protein CcmA (bactofilin family)
MSIFSKKPADDANTSDELSQDPVISGQELNSDQPEERVATPSKPSIISEGFEFVGTITTSGTLNIAGSVKGKITAKSVLVDTSGQVEGEVHSDQVLIKGSLHGEVHCFDLNIGPRADVDGSVSYQNIHIQRGGRVKGQFTKK